MYRLFPTILSYVLGQGSNATGDCCSKCWKGIQAQQKKSGDEGTAATESEAHASPMETTAVEKAAAAHLAEPAPMEVEQVVNDSQESPMLAEKDAPVASLPSKKKKKKKGYKNMMASMMEGHKIRDNEKDKESLRKVVGGGAFSKIDKI